MREFGTKKNRNKVSRSYIVFKYVAWSLARNMLTSLTAKLRCFLIPVLSNPATLSNPTTMPRQDVQALVRQLVNMGRHSHMFCFFPEKGSLMDHLPAMPRDRPCGDSPPGNIAGYPFQPNGNDLRTIRKQLSIPGTVN